MQVTFSGMESSDALKTYAIEKLGKHTNFLTRATSMEVILIESVHSRGVKNDFRVEINVLLPRTKVHVEEKGENMYAVIDQASDILGRRLKRYHDKLNQWEGEEPWKAEDVEVAEDREMMSLIAIQHMFLK